MKTSIIDNTDFFNDLQKLNKDDLVDLIYKFWTQLKKESEHEITLTNAYMSVEFGNIKMTQVNRLKILTKLKTQNSEMKNIGIVCLDLNDFKNYINSIELHYKPIPLYRLSDLCSITLDDYIVTENAIHNIEYYEIIKNIKHLLKSNYK